MVFQAFWCCWTWQGIPSFYESTRLLIRPLLKLPSVWYDCYVVSPQRWPPSFATAPENKITYLILSGMLIKSSQEQLPNAKPTTFYPLHLSWNNEERGHTCQWNWFLVSFPISFEPFENERVCIKIPVHPRQWMQYFCKAPWTKAETLHFSHISMALFQIHHGGVQRQNC